MIKLTLLATALVAIALAARADDSVAQPRVSYELPKACKDAAEAANQAKPMAEKNSMGGMDAVQAANMGAMANMERPMMMATMIRDPDLAFNCGMIIHHQGGIAMSEVELKMGRDELSKAMAHRIIDAQAAEIRKMTERVDALTK